MGTSDSLKKVAESFAPLKIKKYKSIRNEQDDLYFAPTTEASIIYTSKQDETSFIVPTTTQIVDRFESKKETPAYYVPASLHGENKINKARENENLEQRPLI